MFILDWYKEWLEIRSEFKTRSLELKTAVKQEEIICQSCETLKSQLEIANYEKRQLLSRLLEKPEPIEERLTAPEPQAMRPRAVPWHVKKQMLETEDREKARAMREAPKPDSEKANVDELERELKVVETARESTTSV